MIDWIKSINREYPDFWNKYVASFEIKSKEKRYVIISLTKSGTNTEKDVIYSIGGIAMVGDSILIKDHFEIVLLQYKFLHKNGLSNEFIVESKKEKQVEPTAIQSFIEYIGNSTLIGYSVQEDIEMINFALEKMHCGKLKNEALDISIMYSKWKEINENSEVISQLFTLINLPKNTLLNSSEDAYSIALLFQKLKSRLGIK